MNIGEAAKITNLSAKSIRLYEDKGLISAPHRSESGYREYAQSHLDELNLISRARNAGFSLQECKEFVLLARDPERHSRDVRLQAEAKLVEVEAKIAELQKIRHQLKDWIKACPGNSDSHCPILDELTQK